KYTRRSGSRSVGNGSPRSSRNASVTTYWCDIGMSGIRTPAIRPISAANIPPQLTTISQAISPLSVCTRRTRPSSTSMPTTRVRCAIRTPPALARFARALHSCDGSMYPSEGRYAAPTTPLRADQREQLCGLANGYLPQRQAICPRPADLATDLLQPLGTRRQFDAAALGPGHRVLAGL